MKNSPLFAKNFFSIIAGPCSIESLEQLENVALTLKQNKLPFLRGGIFKLRTSSKSFSRLRGKNVSTGLQKSKKDTP